MAVISEDNAVNTSFMLSAQVISLTTSLLSLSIIAVFFWQRLNYRPPNYIKRFTVASLTLLGSYLSSWLFVFILTIAVHARENMPQGFCDVTIYLCLTLYIFTKFTGFLFLIERAYITSFPIEPRWKTPEYVLSCVFLFAPYLAVAGWCIKESISFNNEFDICIIGIHLPALISLLVIEVIDYFYLVIRFLVPVIRCHFNGTGLLPPLRRAVLRTIIGTVVAMLSTLTVKISMTMFPGEPAWLCCMTCKIDTLIAVCVMHWVTVPEEVPSQRETPQVLGLEFDKASQEGNTGRCECGYGSSGTSGGSTTSEGTLPTRVATVEIHMKA